MYAEQHKFMFIKEKMVIGEGEDGLEAVFLSTLDSTSSNLPELNEEKQKQLHLAKKATKGKEEWAKNGQGL